MSAPAYPSSRTCAAPVTTCSRSPNVMPQAHDRDILSRAVSQGRILVTNDKNFGEIIFGRGQAHPGAVLLRLHDESSTNRLRVIGRVLDR